MSTNAPKNIEDQEIDLSAISKGIGNFFQNLNTFFFNTIQFVLKHIVIVSILLITGIGLGIYLDQTQKSYDNQIIVEPNFGSTDYLYSKIELIQSKIKENDTMFFKSIGIAKPKDLSSIDIQPIVDVYKFVTKDNNDLNFELLKLMAEDGDIKKIVEEKTTSKNYKYHIISFKTKSKINDKNMVQPLLNYLNNSSFYKIIQKETVKNTLLKIKSNDLTIAQINGILNAFSSKIDNPSANDKLVYYNENTQLNDVIVTKGKLMYEQEYLKIALVSYSNIIKENSSILNKENKESLNGKLKLFLPFLFIFIYLGVYSFISFYKKQLAKSKA